MNGDKNGLCSVTLMQGPSAENGPLHLMHSLCICVPVILCRNVSPHYCATATHPQPLYPALSPPSGPPRYADIIISYLRTVISDVISRHMAVSVAPWSAASIALQENMLPSRKPGHDANSGLVLGYTAPAVPIGIATRGENWDITTPDGLQLCHVDTHSGVPYPAFCSAGVIRPPFFGEQLKPCVQACHALPLA